MVVEEAKNNTPTNPGHIYVIAPNTTLSISDNILKVSKRLKKAERHMPIDHFFSSLAKDQGPRAIGVILSGNASDGTLGLKAIKSEGGITISQSEETAKHSGMPHSAIVSGCVDFILPPEKIASELVKISNHPYVNGMSSTPVYIGATPNIKPKDQTIFSRILALLYNKIGVDFTYYKKPTIVRRLSRRMVLLKINNLKKYHEYLHNNPSEIVDLYKDITIHVTSFFRDPGLFKVLKNKIFPQIIENNPPNSPIRIWVPGCSSGEEPYSIAISLLEFLKDKASKRPIQIFGSDIDEDLVEKARKGIYLQNIKKNVTAEQLKQYFVKANNGDYQISKSIRDLCVFAKHDVTKDPPFSKVDLISCRNILIYFESALQKKVIPTFHYALNPNGFLVLGPSETINSPVEKFNLVDKKQKIYSKKMGIETYIHGTNFLGFVPRELKKVSERELTLPVKQMGVVDIQKECERLILNKYAPAAVLVNSDLEIIHFQGKTSSYLEPSSGRASFQLMNMAKEGLKMELRQAVSKAMKKNIIVKKEGIYIDQNGKSKEVNIEVNPLKDPVSKERCLLVIFEDATSHKKEKRETEYKITKPTKVTKKEESRRNIALTKELSATKEYLQSIVEQQETSNEELKSANEEILSSNEELQSTNEELETAKEELQSTNEELTTLNEELQNRNETLTSLSNDLNNVLSNTNIAILILGSDLSIRRFTPAAEKIFNLIPGDIGRSITNIKTKINLFNTNIEAKVTEVFDTLKPIEEEVQDSTDKWYSLRIKPYRTSDNKIDGVVITLIDIQLLKETENILQESLSYSNSILETIKDPFIILDKDLRTVSANNSFYTTFKVTQKETENKLIYELGNKQWNIPRLKELLEKILQNKTVFNNYEIGHNFESLGYRTMLLNARQVFSKGLGKELIILAIEDITERKELEEELKRSNEELEYLAYLASHDLQEPLRMISSYAQLLEKRYSEKLDKDAKEFIGFMVGGVNNMKTLINDLLEYSRVGVKEKSIEEFDCNEVINTVLKTITNRISETNSKVTHGSLPKVEGDKQQFIQLFQNLILNSIKYKSENPPCIHISSTSRGNEWLFSVKDNGIGIAKEHQERIFKMFQRLHTKSEYDGTGIGLAICKKIVERHDGKIWVESEEGKGSTFYFTIPQHVYGGGRKENE